MSLSINTPKFLDYFINFSRAIGVKLIDNYIELSQIYISMTPLEQKYHSSKLARELDKPGRITLQEREKKRSLFNYLGIRHQRMIKDSGHVGKIIRKFTQHPITRYKNRLYFWEFIVPTYINLMKNQPYLTESDMKKYLMQYKKFKTKNLYLKSVIPINKQKKERYIERLRVKMVKYNQSLTDFFKNYNILENEDPLRKKFHRTVNKISNFYFGSKGTLNNVNMEIDDDEDDGLDKIGFSFEKNITEKDKIASVEQEAELKTIPLSSKKKKKFKRLPYKYSGQPMKELQIINRLDYLRSERDKIIENVLDMNNWEYYKNKYFGHISAFLKNKSLEYIKSVFADNPKMQCHFIDKLQNHDTKFKYHNDYFQETNYHLNELINDIIQKEIDYTKQINLARKYVENLEFYLGDHDKVTRGNLVKAMAVYGLSNEIHVKYNNPIYGKTADRLHDGSPIVAFFQHVKEIFEKEMKIVDQAKELKLKKMDVGTYETLDEISNKRKELIEDYTNKISNYQNALEVETYADLEKYKLNKLFYSNDLKDSLIDKEVQKKLHEIRLKKDKINISGNEDEYKDLSQLISNLNKLNNQGDKDYINSAYEKIISSLQNKKIKNKGYAFVTFATSEEAKLFYLKFYILGLKLKNNKIKVEPKFDLTHLNFDEGLLYKTAKIDSNVVNRRQELLEAENKLKKFTSNFYQNIEKNEKYLEYERVKDGFRDIFSDPFKKFDRLNPMSTEETEELRYRFKNIKKENPTTFDTNFLFEDDKIEEARLSRDKRITKKYFEYELLKKGIVREDLFKENDHKNNLNKNSLIPDINNFYSQNEEFDLLTENNSHKKKILGRNLIQQNEPIGTSQFIEKYLGKDYLDGGISGFEIDKKESAVYQEIKDLRERFPKEKFTDDPSCADELIKNVNEKFIRLLKHEDNPNGTINFKIQNEDVKEELMDKITNLSPIGKQIQKIISERSIKLDDEEIRQKISLQNYFEKQLYDPIIRKTLLNEIPESEIDSKYIGKMFEEQNPIPPVFRNIILQGDRSRFKNDQNKTEVKYVEGDTSFAAFISARRKYFEKTNLKATNDAVSPEVPVSKAPTPVVSPTKGKGKNKNQFDPNNIPLNEIKSIKDENPDKLLKSIQEKYESYFISKKIPSSEDIDGVTQTKNLSKKIKIEKLKEEFFEEIQKRFSEEIKTLPNFRDYFINLKKSNNSVFNNNRNNNEDLTSLFNFSEILPNDKLRERIALLYNKKITPEIFEKTFAKYSKEREEKMKSWISPEIEEELIKISKVKMGVTEENEKEKMELLRVDNPELFDDNLARRKIEELKLTQEFADEENLELKEANELDDYQEDEYYFNSDCGQTLEEHLSELSSTKFSKITVRTDSDHRIIIRREYKNNYKYDLDDYMNFDLNNEREKLMKKLENVNFKSELEGNTSYYLLFSTIISNHEYLYKERLEEFIKKITNMILKLEDFYKFQFDMPNFNFADFKATVDNLKSLTPEKITNFYNNVVRMIESLEDPKDVVELSEQIREISNFSKNIFNEREVRIFVELIKHSNLEYQIIDIKENNSKYDFIEDTLLSSFFDTANKILNEEEMVYLYGILKFLPKNVNYQFSDENLENKIRSILWNNYKAYMLNEFNIFTKKDTEIRPNLAIETALEQIKIIKDIYDTQYSAQEHNEVVKEINEYSIKLKDYYNDVAKASNIYFLNPIFIDTSEYDIHSLISDDDLFIEEITDQIAKKLKRLKTNKVLTKPDLVRPRFNENSLYKKQLEYVYKTGKRYEALSYREDMETKDEIFESVKDSIRENALKKKKLLQEGKPEIDFEYTRLL